MTRNIVPRNDSEGSLGTSLKRWLSGFFKQIYVNYIKFNPLAQTESPEEGKLWFCQQGKGLKLGISNTVYQTIGRQLLCRVKNSTGSTITKGKVVFVNGYADSIPTIQLSKADTIDTCKANGITLHDIADGEEGYIITSGSFKGIDTSGFNAGDVLFVSPTNAGKLTNVKPSIPLAIATCVTSDTVGKIIINIGEITALAGGDMLQSVYDTDSDGIVDRAEAVDDGSGNSVSASEIKDAVDKSHDQNTDQYLDQGGANEISASDIKSHINNNSNPHNVTPSQIGINSTDDIAEGSTNLYYTDTRVSNNSDVAANTLHRNNTSNPHNVTYDQVGAAAASHTHTESDITDLDKYSQSEIDNFFEGESNGKKLVHWDNITNKFNDSLLQIHDASGGTDVGVTTPVAIPFDTNDIVDSIYTHSTTTNNSRITVNKSGLYEIHVQIGYEDQNSSRANVRARIRKNGTTYIIPAEAYAYSRNSTDAYATISISTFIQLSQGDYIEIMCDVMGSTPTVYTVANTSWVIMKFLR